MVFSPISFIFYDNHVPQQVTNNPSLQLLNISTTTKNLGFSTSKTPLPCNHIDICSATQISNSGEIIFGAQMIGYFQFRVSLNNEHMLSHFSAFYCSFVVMRWNTKNHQDDKQLTLVYSYSLHLYWFGLSRKIFRIKTTCISLNILRVCMGMVMGRAGILLNLTKINQEIN